MGKVDPVDRVLAANLRRLLDATVRQEDGAPVTPTDIEEKTERRITKSTIYRILNCEVSARVEHVAELARAFGLPAWAMLVPGLDPADPPEQASRALVLERSIKIVEATMNRLHAEQKNAPSGRSPDVAVDREVPAEGQSDRGEKPVAEI